jgi:murein DD-endopeptidase MepM/ murein hydrolase activator NlpD
MLRRRSLVLLGLAALVLAGPAQASPAPARQTALGPATSSPAAVLTSADVTAFRAGTTADRSKKRTRPWAYPVKKGTPISGTFGEIGPYWPTGHAGIDFDGELGDPVFAALSGRVITAEFNRGGYGKLVVIRRGDGTEVRYAHLNRILVSVGDRVTAGKRIGRMGTTGQSTGVHLHLEVRVNNGRTPTDPTSIWSGRRPGIPAAPPAWSCAKYGGCVN